MPNMVIKAKRAGIRDRRMVETTGQRDATRECLGDFALTGDNEEKSKNRSEREEGSIPPHVPTHTQE